jgi:(4S)-4-hydroxy-5-phosphonooxypentane-2,3-dione isomerase
MGQFVLVVEFEVKPESVERFHSLIAENAKRSVANEPGCRQFDVMRAQDQANRILLYEVYDDQAAFEAHGKMPHVAEFFREAKPMITEQKARRLERVSAAAKG